MYVCYIYSMYIYLHICIYIHSMYIHISLQLKCRPLAGFSGSLAPGRPNTNSRSPARVHSKTPRSPEGRATTSAKTMHTKSSDEDARCIFIAICFMHYLNNICLRPFDEIQLSTCFLWSLDLDVLWFGCHGLQHTTEFGRRFSNAPRSAPGGNH